MAKSRSENNRPHLKPPRPIYTFRGHASGVTALSSIGETLISGDESGTIHFWSLANFRQSNKWKSVSPSRIQSLKVIKLSIRSVPVPIIVCQTRDNGVRLIRCDDINAKDPSDLVVGEFPTYEALFSRGDAVTTDNGTAILAYPSNVASHLVAVRFLGPDAQTLLSGNASRQAAEKDHGSRHSTVFDIKLVSPPLGKDSHLLICGYEDGIIVIYSFSSSSTKTVPELNVSGLKIESVQELDFEFRDFVGGFDVKLVPQGITIVCGSVRQVMVFCTSPLDFSHKSTERVHVQTKGTSVIAIRDDLKLVAKANWGTQVELFSMKSKIQLASLDNHQEKIQAIIFVQHSQEARLLMCCGSLDKTISVHEIY